MQIVDFIRRTCFEEGELCPFGLKGDVYHFSAFIWCDLPRLENDETIIGLYYAELLGRFEAESQN